MEFYANIRGMGCNAKLSVMLDDPVNGIGIGSMDIGLGDGTYNAVVQNVTGRHAVYLVAESRFEGWFKDMAKDRNLFELVSFVFVK